MFFLLFGFWVLLNGSWTLEIALIGLVVSAALYAFIVKFMGYSPKKEWAIVRRLPRIIGYFLYLVKEVFLSAWATIKLVWSPKLVVEPEITSFHTHVRTLPGKVVLANSITMTPVRLPWTCTTICSSSTALTRPLTWARRGLRWSAA